VSKISIKSTPIPISRWILLFLPMLFSCSTPCPSSEDLAPYNCNQCVAGFSSCIKKNFPIGSNFNELNNYLTKIGFGRAKNPDDIKNNRFYFSWWANDLANYKVNVRGRYNNNLTIIEVSVYP
jgi:hypothetical protein